MFLQLVMLALLSFNLNVIADIQNLIDEFEKNYIAFPKATINNLRNSGTTMDDLKNTHFLLSDTVFKSFEEFIRIKIKFGSQIEKELYSNNFTPINLLDRLIKKRAIVFFLQSDSTLLRNRFRSSNMHDIWKAVGTNKESSIKLNNYLSYDEMMLSSLIGVSGPVKFINDGNRYNKGIINENNIIKQGRIIGLVGARFETRNVMDYSLIIVDQQQNTKNNNYGINTINSAQHQTRLFFAKLFNFKHNYIPTYDELVNDPKKYTDYISINNKYFNSEMYKRRMEFSFELAFADAKLTNKEKYLHIVGLGLGVWSFNSQIQAELIMEVMVKILNNDNKIKNIKAIDFSWFPENGKKYLKIFGINDNAFKTEKQRLSFNYKGIDIIFSKNNPSAKKDIKYNNCELIELFAWDSNSLVGNEYWIGALDASGDPAAAASSNIPITQNPLINKYLNAQNSIIVSNDNGDILKIEENANIQQSTTAFDNQKDSAGLINKQTQNDNNFNTKDSSTALFGSSKTVITKSPKYSRDDSSGLTDKGRANYQKQTTDISSIPLSMMENRTPLEKININIAKILSSNNHFGNEKEKTFIVLLTTGSFNPIHNGHIDMMHSAKQYFDANNMNNNQYVVGGFISPSHDNYVSGKFSNSKDFIPAYHRLNIIKNLISDSDYLNYDAWEASQSGFMDYPFVAKRLQQYLTDIYQNAKFIKMKVYYVCGMDHARKTGLLDRGVSTGVGLVAVKRPGVEYDQIRYNSNVLKKRDVYIVDSNALIENDRSSTMARTYMRSLDLEKVISLNELLNQNTIKYIKENNIIQDYLLR